MLHHFPRDTDLYLHNYSLSLNSGLVLHQMTEPFISPLHCWLKHTAAVSSATSVAFIIGLKPFFLTSFSFSLEKRAPPCPKLEGHVKVFLFDEVQSWFLRNGKCFLPHLNLTTCLVRFMLHNTSTLMGSNRQFGINVVWVWPCVQVKSPLCYSWVSKGIL